MTLTLLHKTKVSSLLNVYRNFGLNEFPDVMGSYRRLSHTFLSCIVSSFLVSAFLSKMFDVGDLPVLTFGN